MTSEKVFFAVLAIAYLALIGAALAPASLGPVATTVSDLVCSRVGCSAGWLGGLVRYKVPSASEPAHKKQKT